MSATRPTPVSLRLPAPLKARLQAQATREGIALHTVLLRTITRGLEQSPATCPLCQRA